MEIWKDIVGDYEYHYQVSSFGRVAKILEDNNKEFLKISKKMTVKLKTLMKAHSNTKVDKLVCQAFIPKINGLNGSTVIHKDGNYENNYVENLEWSVPMSKKYLGEDNYKIYAHISPNGKYYIGQTRLTIGDRWRSNGQGYKHCKVFSKAINKYGWSNFEHIILEDGIKTQKEANEKEQKYIEKYNSVVPNGYNVEFGGVRGKNKSGKKIVCFDSNGKLVKCFDSIYYASLFVDKDRSCISKAISQKIGCGGYYWCNLEDFNSRYVENFLKNYKGRVGRTIYQYDMNTHKLISTYTKVKDAAEKTGINRPDISSCLIGSHKTAGGFIWSYYPIIDFSKYEWKTNAVVYDNIYIYKEENLLGIFNTLPSIEKEYNISKGIIKGVIENKKPVYYNDFIISYRELYKDEFDRVAYSGCRVVEQYDFLGNYIRRFRSVEEATKHCGGKTTSAIPGAIIGYRGANSAYGYKWKYAEPVV